VQLLLLAGPIIASMISRTVMSFVDFVMVSQLGTEAQAAILPAGMILFCGVSFGMGLVQAVNTLAAQCFGRRELPECAAYTWQGLYLSLLFGVAVLGLWPAMPLVFSWFGHPHELQMMEVTYAQIGLLHIGPAIAAVAISGFFNGIHRPSVNFVATILANLFNFVANYALIFGNLGFPAMGIAGAAWATVAASVFNVLILFGWLFLPAYRQPYAMWAMRRLSWNRLMRLVRVGTPMGVQFTTDIIGWSIFINVLVGMFGTVHLAANNVAWKLLEVSFMPALGLGAALTAAVGKCLGRRDPAQARRFVAWCMGILIAYMGTIGLVMLIGRGHLIALLSDDPEVIRIGGYLLIFCAIFQIFDAMNITFMCALRGAGDTRWTAIANMVLVVSLLLALGWGMAVLWPAAGSLGPWAGATLYIIVLAGAHWIRYRRGPWDRMDLFA
jgi:MATE family multidrug resistance protein